MDKKEDCQLRVWTTTALLSFVVAGLLGLLMRLAFVVELPEWMNYSHIKHAHSHVAMLGWIFTGLYIFVIKAFKLFRPVYSRIFWLTQISVLGMLGGFLYQGYGPVSISFSAMHLFISYAFIYLVLKDLKRKSTKSLSINFLKAALYFLFISTLGVWALGPIMNMTEGRSAWYYGAIQFFLHFQFNGWFVFAVIAISLRIIEEYKLAFPQLKVNRFFWLLTISCILTYALAVTWSTPDNYIFWINSIGVSIQFIAVAYLIKIILDIRHSLKIKLSSWVYSMLAISFLALILKIVIQTLVAIPYIATISYTVRNFTIGFIHLLMLGSISLFLISMNAKYFNLSDKKTKGYVYLFLIGLVTSELLLFIQGCLLWATLGFIPAYDLLIFIASFLMFLGILLYTIRAYSALHYSNNSVV